MPYYSLLQKSKSLIFLFVLVITGYAGSAQVQKPVLTLPVGRPNGAMDFSSDGKLLVTNSMDNGFIVWDTRTGFMIRKVIIGRGVQQILVTPDNLGVITVTGIGTGKTVLQKWDLLTGKLIETLPFVSQPGLQFLPNSGYLLAPGYGVKKAGESVTLFDNYERMSGSEEYEDSVEQAFEERMAELIRNGEIEEPDDINDTKKIQEYQKKAMQVKLEMLGGIKHGISIVDNKTMKPVGDLPLLPEHSKPLVYNNTEYLITAYENENFAAEVNKIQVWDIKKTIGLYKGKERAKPVKEFTVNALQSKLAASQVKGFFATSTGKNNIQLWQVDAGQAIATLKTKASDVYSIAFSPGGDTLYAYSGFLQERYIQAWSTATFKQLQLLSLPASYIGEDMYLLPTGNYFAIATTNGMVKLSLTGDSINQFKPKAAVVGHFGFTDNDETIVIRYNEFPDLLGSPVMRYFAKDIEEQAAKEGKKLSKEEVKKILEEKTYMIRTAMSSSMLTSFTRSWNLLKGGAMAGKNYQGTFKVTSADKNYSIINEKYESPNQGSPLKIDEKKKEEVFQSIREMNGDKEETDTPEEMELLEFYRNPENGFTNFLFADSLNGQVTSLINHKTNDTVSLISIDSTDWVMLLKNGYYMTSKNGARSLSYTRGLDVFPFEQFDIQYNRPDLLLKAIGKADPALVEAYRNAYLKRIKKLGIDSAWFKKDFNLPEADFARRDNIAYEQKSGKLQVTINASDKSAKLDRYNIWVNDVPMFGSKGKSIKAEKLQKLDATVEIILSPGKNRIETSVINENGVESYRTPVFVGYTPEVPVKENVFFIGIGISRFSDTAHNLRYCEKDIRDLSQKLKEKYGAALQSHLLFNEEVTVENIIALKQKLLQTTENDKVIIAYSGHGLLSNNYDYYLSTYSVNFDNPEQKGLQYDELENLVDGIKARQKLLLLDACHSGELDKDEVQKITSAQPGLKTKGITPVNKGVKLPAKKLGMKNSFELMQELFVNIGRGTGTTIIAAAGGTQFAQERSDLKNGVFTYTILELMGRVKTITVNELKRYVNSRVYELTEGLQQPVARNEIINTDWKVW